MTLSRNNDALRAAVAAAVVFVLAYSSVRLTLFDGAVAAFWPANAVLLVALLHRPLRDQPLTLLGAFSALTLASALSRGAIASAPVLAIANMAEVIVAQLALRAMTGQRPDLTRRRTLLRFGATAAAAAVASGLIGASALTVLHGAAFGPSYGTWLAAHTLGLLIVAPALMLFTAAGWRELQRPQALRRAAFSIPILLLALCAVFGQTHWSLLFMIPPVLLLVAFTLNATAAAMGVLTTAAISIAAMTSGRGPMMLVDGDMLERILLQQGFLLVLVLTVVPAAAILAGRSRLEAKLREERDRCARGEAELAALLKSSEMAEQVASFGYWSAELGTGTRRWSPGMYSIFGLDPAGGVPDRDAVLAIHAPEDRAMIEGVLSSLQPFEYQARIRRADGIDRLVACRGSLEVADDGRRLLFGVLQDVTEHARALAAAEAAAAAKADFLANMSHELRTPLTGIIGFADLMRRDGELSVEQRKRLDVIDGAGRALLALVNDVLDLSKFENGGVELSPHAFSVGDLVEGVAELVRAPAAAKGLQLDVIMPERTPCLLGDSDRLRQVLLNLASNAVKFTERGRVEIRLDIARRDDLADVTLSVSDTGIGIAPEVLPNLFQRFAQANVGVSRRFGGTGLGLAISRKIVEAIEGDVTVDSVLGQGSRFTVRLSLPVEPVCVSERPDQPLAAETPCTAHVLVAEDQPVNQALIAAVLEPLGCRLTQVGDGGAAVEAVQTADFDLVLMDMQMPGVDGVEATRRIRALGGAFANMPIVALTANVLPEQVARCRDAGMNDHLAKPFSAAALADIVRKWADAATPRSEAESQIAALGSRFGAHRVAGLLRLLDGLFEALIGDDASDLHRLEMAAHSLAGSAGMLGFDDAGTAARALQNAIRNGGDIERARRVAVDASLDARRALSAQLALAA